MDTIFIDSLCIINNFMRNCIDYMSSHRAWDYHISAESLYDHGTC